MLRTALGSPRLATYFTCHSRAASTIRVAPPSGDRHLALPLAFLSLASPEKPDNPWDAWTSQAATRGYSSLVIQLDPTDLASKAEGSDSLLAGLEIELVRLLQDPAHSSPFPPLLFAHSSASLLAETYVSSNPLSGLCLVSPLSALQAHAKLPKLFKSPLAEFNYEPGFPIAVVQREGVSDQHRLLQDFAEEDDEDALAKRIAAERDVAGWDKVQEWMDENGL
ncbi:hypothetical protein JCM11641_006834 [Rhodosporidiobolus odoratus]